MKTFQIHNTEFSKLQWTNDFGNSVVKCVLVKTSILEDFLFCGVRVPLVCSEFCFSNNQIRKVPKTLGELHRLRMLDLEENNLDSLPAEIERLQNLHTLLLSSNKLTTLPRSIGSVPSCPANSNQFTFTRKVVPFIFENYCI